MADLWICVHRKSNTATVIDETDLPLLSHVGFLWLNQTAAGKFYVMAEWRDAGKLKRAYLHRLLLGLEKGDPLQADHRDNDPLNNRRSNLRVVTRLQNAQNQRYDRTPYGRTPWPQSRHRGVHWNPSNGCWQAAAGLNGETIMLGLFDDEDRAAEVARAYRREHMPFALN